MSLLAVYESWIDKFVGAWHSHDGAAFAALFTTDGQLFYSPLEQPVRGREALRQFWEKGTDKQSDLVARYGKPELVGDRVIVEWWATLKNDGEPTTEPGCALITLDADGLCREMREYSAVRRAHIAEPPNWLNRR